MMFTGLPLSPDACSHHSTHSFVGAFTVQAILFSNHAHMVVMQVLSRAQLHACAGCGLNCRPGDFYFKILFGIWPREPTRTLLVSMNCPIVFAWGKNFERSLAGLEVWWGHVRVASSTVPNRVQQIT
jgi:hypothetical protein